MLRKQDYNTYTLIAKDIPSSALAVGTEVKPSNTSVGEVFITDKANRVLASYPATGSCRLIQSMGATKPLKIVDIEDVTKVKVTWSNFKREVQEKVIIGFNPATNLGALPTANSTSYWIKIKKLDNDAANRSQAVVGITAQYKTSSTATQREVAHGLASQLFKNVLFETINHGVNGQQEYIAVKIVSNATIIAGAVATGDVQYGSKLVQCTAAPVVAPGQEIQILGDSYLVSAVDPVNFTITLAEEYRGVDATALPIDDAFTTPATNYGIEITGVKNPFDVVKFRDYYTNRFQVSFSDSSTPVVEVAKSFEGVGVYEEVAMNEYMSWGFVGQNHTIATPPELREKISTAGKTYGTVQFRWFSKEEDLLTTSNFKGSVLLYCELAPTAPDTLTAGNAGGVVLSQLVANATLSAAGLTLTSLDE